MLKVREMKTFVALFIFAGGGSLSQEDKSVVPGVLSPIG